MRHPSVLEDADAPTAKPRAPGMRLAERFDQPGEYEWVLDEDAPQASLDAEMGTSNETAR